MRCVVSVNVLGLSFSIQNASEKNVSEVALEILARQNPHSLLKACGASFVTGLELGGAEMLSGSRN